MRTAIAILVPLAALATGLAWAQPSPRRSEIDMKASNASGMSF